MNKTPFLSKKELLSLANVFVKTVEKNKTLVNSTVAARYFTKSFIYEMVLPLADDKRVLVFLDELMKPLLTRDQKLLSSIEVAKIDALTKKAVQEAKIKRGGGKGKQRKTMKKMRGGAFGNNENVPPVYFFAQRLRLIGTIIVVFSVMLYNYIVQENNPEPQPVEIDVQEGIQEGVQQVNAAMDIALEPPIDLSIIPYVGVRNVSAGKHNLFSFENIKNGDDMVSTEGLFGLQPLKMSSLKTMIQMAPEGSLNRAHPKKFYNSDHRMRQQNLFRYTARIVGGGTRKKQRS